MTVDRSLGGVYDPFGEHLQNPYPFYARARQEQPIFFSQAIKAWVVTRYEDVREALLKPEIFSSANTMRPLTLLYPATLAELLKGYLPARGLIESDGNAHRRLRVPVARALSRRVEAVEPVIQRHADELVDGFAVNGSADLMSQYAYRLPVNIIAHLVGLDPRDLDVAYAGSYGGNMVVAARLSEPEQAAAAHDMIAFHQMCRRYVYARHAEPRDDLLSEVIAALVPADGPLSLEQEVEVARVIMGLFVAGHITTSGLVGNAIRHLLTRRDQWELLCSRPELIDNAVEEIARYDTPVQGFLRVTTKPTTLGGVELSSGAELLLLYASANHDQVLCNRPEVFDITRQPTRHLTFAAGRHTCVGAGLSRRELAVTLRTLVRRLPSLRLIPNQEFEIQGMLTAHGLRSLHVTW
jgi:cytochrome P450